MKNFKRFINLATLVVFLCSNFLVPISYAQEKLFIQREDNVLMDFLFGGKNNMQDFNLFSDHNPEIENHNHEILQEVDNYRNFQGNEAEDTFEEDSEGLEQIESSNLMVAPASTSVTLLPGTQFNVAIKKLSGQTGNVYSYTENRTIRGIVQTGSIPGGVTTGVLSVANSTYPVYAWFDNGIIYYYTEASIVYMNQNSSYMFYEFTNLTDISSLSNWDTSSVTNMSWMFGRCSSLTGISSLSDWDTSSVTNMSVMFSSCDSLTDISALSGWDTSKVTNMSYMFSSCDSLADISALSDWDTSRVTDMSSMFYNCGNLTDISALSDWDTSKVTDMSYMFSSCDSLALLDLSNWDTSSVTNMSWMLGSCSKLETIYVSTGFVISGDAQSDNMFNGTKNLIGGNGTEYDVNHTDAEYARIDTEVNSGYFTDINGDTSIVRFETNGGDKLHSQVVTKGGTVDLMDPQKKNSTFKGWFIDSGLTENFIESTPIYSNLKLYAKWECEAGYKEQYNKCVNEEVEYKYENGIIKISDGNDRIYFKDRNEGVDDDQVVKYFRLFLALEIAGANVINEIQEQCNDEECMEGKVLDYVCENFGVCYDTGSFDGLKDSNIELILFKTFGNIYFWGNNTGVNVYEIFNGEISDLNEIISKGFDGGNFGDIEGSGWIEGENSSPCDWSKGEYLPTSQDWKRLISIWSSLRGYNAEDISNSMSHFIDSTDSIYGVVLDEETALNFVLDMVMYPFPITLTYNGSELEEFYIDGFIPAFWGSQSKSGDVGLTIVENADPSLNLSIEYIEADQITDEAVEKINSIALPVRCFIKVPVVKFETNGGSSMDDIDVFKGEKIVLENQPSKINATFDGWYKDEGLTEKWDVENDVVEEDITLYAKWIENKPSGSSSGGGGGGGSSSSNTGSAGSQTGNQINSNTGSIASGTNEKEPEGTGNNAGTQTGNVTDTSEQLPQNGDKDTQGSLSQGGQQYSEEFQQAYVFAKGKGITTMPTIQKANMNGPLTRIAMAKMLSQYAINVLGREPDVSKGVANFNDVTRQKDRQYDNGVTLAYQLGIMGQNMPGNNFRPNDEVSRAEFVTALSRLLYSTSDGEYKSTSKYYTHHMEKLKKEGIITKDNPSMKERRGYVMIMLMRSAKK